jgi:hypothetical protein
MPYCLSATSHPRESLGRVATKTPSKIEALPLHSVSSSSKTLRYVKYSFYFYRRKVNMKVIYLKLP